MLFKHLLPVSAVLAVAAATETHGGVDFDVRFSWGATQETRAIKDVYEAEAAKQASQRLQAAIGTTGIAADCLTESTTDLTPDALYALKDCIAAEDPNIFFDLLVDDIEEANTFWDTVISESTTDRSQWVPARTYVRGFFNGSLTAVGFASWTASDLADAANNRANPEHYFKKTVLTSTGSQSSNIFEGWGGVKSSFGMKRTNFTVPEFTSASFGTAEYPQEWAIDSSFVSLLSRMGPKVLVDGQTYGVLHIAVRDIVEDGRAGVEVYAAVWYPPWDQASEADHDEFVHNYLADESEHMVVEIINLTLKARSDLTPVA